MPILKYNYNVNTYTWVWSLLKLPQNLGFVSLSTFLHQDHDIRKDLRSWFIFTYHQLRYNLQRAGKSELENLSYGQSHLPGRAIADILNHLAVLNSQHWCICWENVLIIVLKPFCTWHWICQLKFWFYFSSGYTDQWIIWPLESSIFQCQSPRGHCVLLTR
jgi:hypothetical protein